jgi:hypothetical protein
MAPVHFSLTGIFDIISGIFLYFTLSPIPESVAIAHAFILIYKGSATILPLPLGMPGFILGSAADLMSAAILITGNPPLLGDYKIFLAGFLFLKGTMGFLSMMNM